MQKKKKKKKKKAREVHKTVLSSPSEVITMLNRTDKTRDKEQCKTQHEKSLSKNHKAIQIRIKPGPSPENGRQHILPGMGV